MRTASNLWKSVWQKFAFPKVNSAELESSLQRIRRDLPVPVFWLLGKAQSGKTSLIRALTENTRAEIGNGIRACTKTATVYSFPGEDDCIVRFLDTRGLGEVNYDPAEDIAMFQDQAHLLIVIIKALDHAQQPVMKALKSILRARPHWPVLVVQTTLHEGYPSQEQQHIEPYPYGESFFPRSVPENLARSLLSQREMFLKAGIDAKFVPVDFTLAEDGYENVDYGLEALWNAIEELLPLGLRGMLQHNTQTRKNLRDAHLRTAHPHILSYSIMAGAAATFPVPMVDVPLVMAIQAKMFHAIASIYHQELNRTQIAEVLSTLGLGYVGRLGARELLKFIPGYGSAIAAAYASASTYAIGLTLCVYFSQIRDGDLPDKAAFQKIYETHFLEGHNRLSTYRQAVRKKPQEMP